MNEEMLLIFLPLPLLYEGCVLQQPQPAGGNGSPQPVGGDGGRGPAHQGHGGFHFPQGERRLLNKGFHTENKSYF